MEPLRPKVARIGERNKMTKIIYCCPCCGTEFAIYRNSENYCHCCGQKIAWDNAFWDVSYDIAIKYRTSDYEGKKKLLKDLNKALELPESTE